MKLREFKFRDIQNGFKNYNGLSIFDGDKEVAIGYFSEVLTNPIVISLADREIKSTNDYFDIFVIRL